MTEPTVELKFRRALEQLVGASKPDELRGMATTIEAVATDDADAQAALAAIKVLLDNPERSPDEFHAEIHIGVVNGESSLQSTISHEPSLDGRLQAFDNVEVALEAMLRQMRNDAKELIAKVGAKDAIDLAFQDMQSGEDAAAVITRYKVRMEGGE